MRGVHAEWTRVGWHVYMYPPRADPVRIPRGARVSHVGPGSYFHNKYRSGRVPGSAGVPGMGSGASSPPRVLVHVHYAPLSCAWARRGSSVCVCGKQRELGRVGTHSTGYRVHTTQPGTPSRSTRPSINCSVSRNLVPPSPSLRVRTEWWSCGPSPASCVHAWTPPPATRRVAPSRTSTGLVGTSTLRARPGRCMR